MTWEYEYFVTLKHRMEDSISKQRELQLALPGSSPLTRFRRAVEDSKAPGQRTCDANLESEVHAEKASINSTCNEPAGKGTTIGPIGTVKGI